ncbi:PrpR N-terminal domain-containing protein [Paenibacillus cellulositrophicus]|uniref:sigma-54-dependent transcriptional regulator n=1 Tax=Paenibacillus cellulositrophicus TaxID=562959 RepID=UPI00204237EA|nr:sigma-54-dependent transcriptional regulator [Paenibacillus cellulositrophicus]MCM3001009.1 PrpR N-terminal domain-containing protein [Paenibacillus cellulositrophicus]
MRIKALFIAPYAAMENLIETCRAEEKDLDLQIRVGNLQEGVAIAKQAEAEGVDVIISRGGTAKLIGEAVDIPVVDVHVSGYDMLRVLTLANDFPRKKAIVGFPAITLGAKAIIDLLEIPIDIFTIHDEDETESLLRKLKEEGYQLIMGDVVTFETASRLGLVGILIQSGREAIFDAFQEAKTVSRWMMKNRLEIERLKAVLQVTAGDVMVLAENGQVVYEQWKHFDSRPVPHVGWDHHAFRETAAVRETSHASDAEGRPLKIVKTRVTVENGAYLVCEFSRVHMNSPAEAVLQVKTGTPPLIIHQSEAMDACLSMIDRCLSAPRFVLIGPRGAGKELIARYIHDRKFGGEGLLASVQAADMLALEPDEVDAEIKTLHIHALDMMDSSLRAELWRRMDAFQGKGITLIFSMVEEQHLWGAYEDGIVRIHVPALAERKEDIRELVTSFLLYFNQTQGTSAIKMTDKGLALLMDYSWPGNVSELRALLQEAVLLEKGYVIEHALIEQLLQRKGEAAGVIGGELLNGTLEQIEKAIIEKVLEQEGFNQTKAAKRLNINRSTLWRKLKD